jgi:hypothetical protein
MELDGATTKPNSVTFCMGLICMGLICMGLIELARATLLFWLAFARVAGNRDRHPD